MNIRQIHKKQSYNLRVRWMKIIYLKMKWKCSEKKSQTLTSEYQQTITRKSKERVNKIINSYKKYNLYNNSWLKPNK